MTSAIEAYEVYHRAKGDRRAFNKLETIGLLWGYMIPEKGDYPARVIVSMATVETSALRSHDCVMPDPNYLKAKVEFLRNFYPNIELVGTFHSHPYDSLSEVKNEQGWRASMGSDCDEGFFPWIHQHCYPDQPIMAHLVVTIIHLEKKWRAYPDRLKGNEGKSGYVLSAGRRKIWLRSYASNCEFGIDGNQYSFSDDMELDLPSLQKRFY